MPDASSIDPYRPSSSADAPYVSPDPSKRSGWLVTVCVISIVLGAFGALNGLTGLGGVIFQKQLQSAFPQGPQPGVPAELQDAQKELNDQVQQLQGEFALLLGSAAVVRIGIGLALAIGGIGCLRRNGSGYSLLQRSLAAATAFEVASGVLQSAMMMRMVGLLNAFFEKMVESMPDQNGAPPDFMLAIVRGFMWFGFALGMIWLLVKVGFYLSAYFYLRRPGVADQCKPVVATLSENA